MSTLQIIRNVLGLILGVLIGGLINAELVKIGHSVYPIKNLDPNDSEAYIKLIPTLDKQYFIFPFIAHALGTLIGSSITAFVAFNKKILFAFLIGFIFLLGGIIMMVFTKGKPIWFCSIDLVLAYLPMAWLGGKTGLFISKKKR